MSEAYELTEEEIKATTPIVQRQGASRYLVDYTQPIAFGQRKKLLEHMVENSQTLVCTLNGEVQKEVRFRGDFWDAMLEAHGIERVGP